MTPHSIVVIVTGVGGGAFGEQILKALRLATTAYEIVAVDMDATSKGFADADHAEIVPPASDTGYVDALLEVARRRGARAIFPGSEPELAVLSAHRDRVRSAGILLPIDRAEVIDLCLNKARTFEFLATHGFRIPRWRVVRTAADLADAVPLPAVMKPTRGGGSANVFLAQRERDVVAFGAHLLEIVGEFMIQEYIGDPASEYTVGVLSDMDGRFINSIAVHRDLRGSLSTRLRVRNLTGREDLGPTLVISSGISQGEIGPYRQVTGTAEAVAAALGSQGPINIQCRLVGGVAMPFEINPRFSGTTSIRAMAGYNEPDVLIRRHLLGESIPERFPYAIGRVRRGLSETFIRA